MPIISSFHISNEKHVQNSMWFTSIIGIFILIVLFVFQDVLINWKESLKASIRKTVYKSLLGISLENDTIISNESGFLLSFVKSLDELFLKPTDDSFFETFETAGEAEEEEEEEEEEEDEEEEEEEEDEEEDEEDEEDEDDNE
jgi:hypothetical protein